MVKLKQGLAIDLTSDSFDSITLPLTAQRLQKMMTAHDGEGQILCYLSGITKAGTYFIRSGFLVKQELALKLKAHAAATWFNWILIGD